MGSRTGPCRRPTASPTGARGEWLNEATLAEIGPRLAELFQRLFSDARETFPLPYQPFAVPEAVAALDALSIRDRLDATELSSAERDLAGALLGTGTSAARGRGGF